MRHFACLFALTALLLCSCHTSTPTKEITAEMAYEGVNNYCHEEYDWTIAKENPDIMYVTMGEETDSAYQVIFRSYTASFIYFYVDKASGTTRMVECAPGLDMEDDDGERQSSVGTINLFDYLEKD